MVKSAAEHSKQIYLSLLTALKTPDYRTARPARRSLLLRDRAEKTKTATPERSRSRRAARGLDSTSNGTAWLGYCEPCERSRTVAVIRLVHSLNDTRISTRPTVFPSNRPPARSTATMLSSEDVIFKYGL
jgi:hypothetical protein